MKFFKTTYWIGKEILTFKKILLVLILALGFSYFLGIYSQLYISNSEVLTIGNSTLKANPVFKSLTTNLYLIFSIYNLVLLYLLKEIQGLLIDKAFLTHTLVRPVSRKEIYLAIISFSSLFIFTLNSLLYLLITSLSITLNDIYLGNFISSIILLFPYSIFISIIYTSLVFFSSDKITGFVYLFIYLYIAPALFEFLKIWFIDSNQITNTIIFLVNEILFGAGSLSYSISIYQVEGFLNPTKYFNSALLPILLSYFVKKQFDKINI